MDFNFKEIFHLTFPHFVKYPVYHVAENPVDNFSFVKPTPLFSQFVLMFLILSYIQT